MTPTEKMAYEREAIKQALLTANCAEVSFNKDDIPKELPAAIVILENETGKNGTSRRYVDTDIAWTVYLVVNAFNVSDPDSDLYALKEAFRSAYQASMGRDIPRCEYYSGRVDGARPVRIARLDLLRAGTGAGA